MSRGANQNSVTRAINTHTQWVLPVFIKYNYMYFIFSICLLINYSLNFQLFIPNYIGWEVQVQFRQTFEQPKGLCGKYFYEQVLPTENHYFSCFLHLKGNMFICISYSTTISSFTRFNKHPNNPMEKMAKSLCLSSNFMSNKKAREYFLFISNKNIPNSQGNVSSSSLKCWKDNKKSTGFSPMSCFACKNMVLGLLFGLSH